MTYAVRRMGGRIRRSYRDPTRVGRHGRNSFLEAPWSAYRFSIRTLRLCTAAIFLSTAVACRNGDSSGPGVPNVNGTWSLSSLVRNDASVACSVAGSVTISQSGQLFTGAVSGSSVVCYTTQGDSTLNGNIDGSFTNGAFEHNVALSFSESVCYFSNAFVSPATQINGTLHCNISDQGDTAAFNGRFSLERVSSGMAARMARPAHTANPHSEDRGS